MGHLWPGLGLMQATRGPYMGHIWLQFAHIWTQMPQMRRTYRPCVATYGPNMDMYDLSGYILCSTRRRLRLILGSDLARRPWRTPSWNKMFSFYGIESNP